MDKFTTLTGIAAPMPLVNIDTDMIIPKQFLKTIQRSGLGKNLFDEMRYTQDGQEIPDFVLNQPAYRSAQILVAGDNFGCGSSREHAPWALLDFGIRCVISTSFADIFYNNCFQNGILPAKVSKEDLKKLMDGFHHDAHPMGMFVSTIAALSTYLDTLLAGALLFATARSASGLGLAMLLIGAGCAPVLMASYYIFARTYSAAVFGTLAGAVLSDGLRA